MLYSHSTYHDTVFCNEFSKSTLSTQPTCPGGAQLGLPTWEQDGLEPGFQVGSKWASPFIKKISFTYALS